MKNTLITASGWGHWIIPLLWYVFGQPTSGAAIWAYALSFCALWSVSCASVVTFGLFKVKNHPWAASVHTGWYLLAVLGIVSPAALFAI